MQASQCKLEGVNIDPRSSPVNLGGLKLSDSGDARTESSKKRRHWNMFGRVMAGVSKKIAGDRDPVGKEAKSCW